MFETSGFLDRHVKPQRFELPDVTTHRPLRVSTCEVVGPKLVIGDRAASTDILYLSARVVVTAVDRLKGLGNEFIAPKTTSIGTFPVTCRARLGGLLKFYDREAA
jgi:hypothetical protein